MRRSLVLVLVLVVASSSPSRALGDEPPLPPIAPPALPRAAMRDTSVEETVSTGVLAAALLATSFVPMPTHQQPQWRGGVLLDDPIRRALVLDGVDDRRLASTISDVLVSTLVLAPILVDATLVAGLGRGDPELMGRMLLMNLQAHAVAQGLTMLFKHAVGRERPVARGCREDPSRREEDPRCQGSSDPDIAPVSFTSGHASLAFTSAALMCLQHTRLGLYGPEGGAVMCATGIALATTVGLLRIASDNHYASDVIAGAVIGVLAGWLVPWLLHFDVAEAVGVDGATATVAPMTAGQSIGVQISGTF